MIENLAGLPLKELLEKALELGVVDGWESVDEAVVVELATMRTTLEKRSARPFVRGLLRGYERALMMEREHRISNDARMARRNTAAT